MSTTNVHHGRLNMIRTAIGSRSAGLRIWATSYRSSPIAHRRVLLLALAIGIIIGGLTGSAFADDGSPSAFGPFDMTDSDGIKASQYQLSIDQGGVTHPIKAITAFFELAAWDTYRFWISFLAWLIDWALKMEWVDWIVGPLNALQTSLRDNFLSPLHLTAINGVGIMGLFFTIAAAVGGWHLFRGRTGRAVGEWFSSAVVAVLAVGILATPVTLFIGSKYQLAEPLQKAQSIGTDLANLAAGKKLSQTLDNHAQSPAAAPGPQMAPVEVPASQRPKFGILVIDTFLRPVHQQLNYGTSIDENHKECVPAYNKALKQGPYGDDASQQRGALKKCADGTLKKYADATSLLSVVGLMQTFMVTVALLSIVLVLFVALMVLSVVMIGVSALKMLIHAPIAILPGDTKLPLIRDLIDVATSIVYIVVSIPMLSAILRVMKSMLGASRAVPIQVRFIAVGLLLVGGAVVLIGTYIAHRRGSRGFVAKFRDLLSAKDRQSVGDRARNWAGQPSQGALSAANSPSGPGGRPAVTGTSSAVRGAALRGGRSRLGSLAGTGMQRAVSSNGAQLALGVAGVASGGTAAVASRAAKTAVTGYKAIKATPKTTRRAIVTARNAPAGAMDRAAQAKKTYEGFRRVGGPHVTTGNDSHDKLLHRTARAHNFVARRVGEASDSTLGARVKDSVHNTRGALAARDGNEATQQKLNAALRDLSRPERVKTAQEGHRADRQHVAAVQQRQRAARKLQRTRELVAEGFYKPERAERAQLRYRDARNNERAAADQAAVARQRTAQAKELTRLNSSSPGDKVQKGPRQ